MYACQFWEESEMIYCLFLPVCFGIHKFVRGCDCSVPLLFESGFGVCVFICEAGDEYVGLSMDLYMF